MIHNTAVNHLFEKDFQGFSKDAESGLELQLEPQSSNTRSAAAGLQHTIKYSSAAVVVRRVRMLTLKSEQQFL